jgi:hypothetical protein
MDYDDVQAGFEEEAKRVGAITEAARLAHLRSVGQWSDAKEEAIVRQRDAIGRFEAGRHTIAVPSVLRSHDEQIERERATLLTLLTERAALIGSTVESYGQQRLEDYYLVHNLFKDKDMTEQLFDFETFDDLNDAEVNALHEVYRAAIEPCADSNMRYLAVQDFFFSYFTLCEDDLSAFYGLPVCAMTYYQVRLGNIARYFKRLLGEADLSRLAPESRNDPDAIERLSITEKNKGAMQADGKLPSGLSSQDIKEMGLEGQYTKLPDKELSGVELVKHFMKQNQTRNAGKG